MSLKSIYDQYYTDGYRKSISGYEIARWNALHHFVTKILKIHAVTKVMDYGAGRGLHMPLWETLFPDADLNFCDISTVAKEIFINNNEKYRDKYYIISDGIAECEASAYDLIISIEVMEHVESLDEYLSDIFRLLKPGGHFIWTTPCANHFSIEHLYGKITGAIEKTAEGYSRWSWEDPTHIRRMASRDLVEILASHNFCNIILRFRAHFFSFACTCLPFPERFTALRNRLMCLDYMLFRWLPNGASMIGAARKSASSPI